MLGNNIKVHLMKSDTNACKLVRQSDKSRAQSANIAVHLMKSDTNSCKLVRQSDKSRAQSANIAVEFVKKLNFDGIDIDYGYPMTAEDAANFVLRKSVTPLIHMPQNLLLGTIS